MEINGVEIKDTYAEGFGIKVTRILVTAATPQKSQQLKQLVTELL